MIIKWKKDGPDFSFKFRGLTFTAYWTIHGWEANIQDTKKNGYTILYTKMFKTLEGCKKHLVLRINVMNDKGWSK
jgi:hypothetical protein